MSSPSAQRRPPTQEELARMSLMEHLEELRKRLFWSILSVAVAFIPCWIYVRQIFDFLQQPIQKIRPGEKLVFTGLADPFLLSFKVAAPSPTTWPSPRRPGSFSGSASNSR